MTADEHNSRCAFRPIAENSIVLDLTECRYLGEVHRLLKEAFGLPEYYGENWAALWDCLSGLFDGRGEYVVYIRGLSALPVSLRVELEPMLAIFEEVHGETPNVTFTVE